MKVNLKIQQRRKSKIISILAIRSGDYYMFDYESEDNDNNNDEDEEGKQDEATAAQEKVHRDELRTV